MKICRLSAQVENNDLFIFNCAGETVTQVLIKGWVIFQPPEAGPNKADEGGAGFPHALEFGDGGAIILGRTPVFAPFFQERQRIAMREFTADLLLVDQDKRLFDRD